MKKSRKRTKVKVDILGSGEVSLKGQSVATLCALYGKKQK